jgi:hypothetical protein
VLERVFEAQLNRLTAQNSVDATSTSIDKSALAIAAPRRLRDEEHLAFVATLPCLICARTPSQAHHLRFAQPRAIGLKVSDEFTVPLCRGHHRQLHQIGNEIPWWENLKIKPLEIAKELWDQTRPKATAIDNTPAPLPNDETKPIPVDPQ